MPAPGGICERGLYGRVYGRCRSLFVVCGSIEAFLSRAAVSLCCHAFRAPGHKFYLEIATQKNWRSGTRDLDPERLCGVQAMVHFLTNRFRDVDVRAVQRTDGLPKFRPRLGHQSGPNTRGWGVIRSGPMNGLGEHDHDCSIPCGWQGSSAQSSVLEMPFDSPVIGLTAAV